MLVVCVCVCVCRPSICLLTVDFHPDDTTNKGDEDEGQSGKKSVTAQHISNCYSKMCVYFLPTTYPQKNVSASYLHYLTYDLRTQIGKFEDKDFL